MFRYHQRATRQAALVEPSDALERLTRRDKEERTLWFGKHRSSASALGSMVTRRHELQLGTYRRATGEGHRPARNARGGSNRLCAPRLGLRTQARGAAHAHLACLGR
eukprot:3272526-Heterocapsa_arctica.AAC.1